MEQNILQLEKDYCRNLNYRENGIIKLEIFNITKNNWTNTA